jgi:hypothetical protein
MKVRALFSDVPERQCQPDTVSGRRTDAGDRHTSTSVGVEEGTM